MDKLSPNAEGIRRRLSGETVVGRRPEPTLLTDMELGALAVLVWGPGKTRDAPLAYRLIELLRAREPLFDEETAVAALEALDASAAEGSRASENPVVSWMQEAAAKIIVGCAAGLSSALGAPLLRLVKRGLDGEPSHLGTALRSCAGLQPVEHPDPLVQRELSFVGRLLAPRDRIVMARLCSGWAYGVDDDELTPRGADPVALIPGYLDLARTIVEEALAHVSAIHSGRVPYSPDKAFSVHAAQVLRRALLAGLDQDASWALGAAGRLFAGVSIAPQAEVKTVPSQSAATAIAKAIAERPSIELVAELKSTISSIRHAGVKKKASTFLKTAERRLAEREDFLLHLDERTEVPKSMRATVVRSLEALLLRREPLPFEVWRQGMMTHHSVAQLAGALVWRIAREPVLPHRDGKQWMFLQADGQPVELAAGPVWLWHPLGSPAEAEDFRRLIVSRKLHQPFNQVFRETYSEASVPQLLSPDLDVSTLLGLARSQGWTFSPDRNLVRRRGPLRIELDVGQPYPGAAGITRCRSIQLLAAEDGKPCSISREDPLLVSECLRAVDLLISVSAFAVSEEGIEPASARARQAALLAMLGDDRSRGTPYVEGRYVRAGDVSISIATGRAMRAGAEVEIPDADNARMTLPYPDEILRRVVAGVNHLA